jgi:hypothetical protein
MLTHERNRTTNKPRFEARSWQRINCNLHTQIAVAGGERWDCTIINISQRGFGIVTEVKLRKGDKVNIIDPQTKAKIAWTKNNLVGLAIVD